MQPRHVFLVAPLFAVYACGKGGDSTQTAAMAPTRSGDVWEVDSAASRAGAPGALEAFINGVHVMVIDGNRVYAGSQSFTLSAGDGGARQFQLADGSTAQLVPLGDALDLRFATGEHVRMKRQAEKGGTQ